MSKSSAQVSNRLFHAALVMAAVVPLFSLLPLFIPPADGANAAPRSVCDIITAIEGKVGKLAALLDDYKVGDMIRLSALRQEKLSEVKVAPQSGEKS